MNARLLFAALSLAASFVSASAPTASSKSKSVLPFIEDDYGKALSEARAKHRPIFVEAWAPW